MKSYRHGTKWNKCLKPTWKSIRNNASKHKVMLWLNFILAVLKKIQIEYVSSLIPKWFTPLMQMVTGQLWTELFNYKWI